MAPNDYIPPNIAGMDKFDSTAQMEGYQSWSPDELADYFESEGLGNYREVLTYHKITGKIAPQLKDEDLKDMGIKIVGDRCRFRHVIKGMNRKARFIQRNKIIWHGKEQLWFDKCEGCLNTCCGIFPEDPSTYKLTNNHLKVKTVEPARCGPLRLCCCNKYSNNNIDLSTVEDIDMENINPPVCQQLLCCANGKEVLDVSVADQDSVYIVVAQGDGDTVSAMILNQVEESQMIERD